VKTEEEVMQRIGMGNRPNHRGISYVSHGACVYLEEECVFPLLLLPFLNLPAAYPKGFLIDCYNFTKNVLTPRLHNGAPAAANLTI
jgi:hypothetical protein